MLAVTDDEDFSSRDLPVREWETKAFLPNLPDDIFHLSTKELHLCE